MADGDLETWEATGESTVWVHVKDARMKTGWNHKRVGGPGSGTRKINLTREEREYNQEQVLDENEALDPFTNGSLICVKGRPAEEKSRYELSNEDLMGILTLEDDALFAEAVADIDIEMPLRRLLNLAEKHAPLARYEVIRNVVDDRYRTGGPQPSVLRMQDSGDDAGVMSLSGN